VSLPEYPTSSLAANVRSKLSQPEFRITPIGEPTDSLPDFAKFDKCNACFEGRLHSQKVRTVSNPFWAPLALYFGYMWAICGTVAAFVTFCFGTYSVCTITNTTERIAAAVSMSVFFVVFTAFAVAGWALLRKRIVFRCELCGETISKEVYLARLRPPADATDLG